MLRWTALSLGALTLLAAIDMWCTHDRRLFDISVVAASASVSAYLFSSAAAAAGLVRRGMRGGGVLALLVALLFAWGALGSWPFFEARAASRRGDCRAAIEGLRHVLKTRESRGVTVTVSPFLDARVTDHGLVWVGEANVCLGLAVNYEAVAETRTAVSWYERTLRAYDRSRVGVSPAEVRTRLARLDGAESGY